MPSGLRALNDEMTGYIAEHLKGFVSKREDGALVGPFAPMLRLPTFGRAAWTYTKALIDNSKLPKPAHEAAILVTGAAFNSRYELYAHERVGYNLWGKLLTGAWILEGACSAIILGWAATRFRARDVKPVIRSIPRSPSPPRAPFPIGKDQRALKAGAR
jgi:hypothetical protein